MDPKDLSKQKYIYKLYKASDHRYHVEKFPIIYANKSVVYFAAQYPYLSSVQFDNVFDNTDSMDERRIERKILYGHQVYFWNEPSNVDRFFNNIKKHNLKERFETCEEIIREKRDAIKRYEQEMVDIALELEALE